MGEPKSRELSEQEVEAWFAIAAMRGFNEMAREAETLGERVFFRVARADCERRLQEMGIDTNLVHDATVLRLPYDRPEINFTENDVALMREFLARHDAALSSEQQGGGK